MESITSTLPDVLSSMNLYDKGLETFKKTEALKVDLHIQKSADITLYTAEGDKVTLTALSSLDAGYSIYTSQGIKDGVVSQTEVKAAYLSKEFAYQLSVEGDLRIDEVNDSRKALKTIGKMAGDFFSGNTSKAIKRATKLSGLDTLSSIEAVLHYERSVSAVYARTTEAITAPTSEPVKQIPQEPATPKEAPVSKQILDPAIVTPPPPPPPEPKKAVQPAPKATTPTGVTTSPEPSGITSATEEQPAVGPKESLSYQSIIQVNIKRLIEKIVSVVLESNVETGKLAKYTSRFLDYFSASYSLKSSENVYELKLITQIQTEFRMRIEEAAESKEKETAVSKPASEPEKVDSTHKETQKSNRTRRKSGHTHRGHHRSRPMGKMAGDFFSGNIGKALKQATTSTGLGSISSFEVVQRYERSVSVQFSRTTEAPSVSASEDKEAVEA